MSRNSGDLRTENKKKKKEKEDRFDTEDRSSVLKLDTRHVTLEKRRVAPLNSLSNSKRCGRV